MRSRREPTLGDGRMRRRRLVGEEGHGCSFRGASSRMRAGAGAVREGRTPGTPSLGHFPDMPPCRGVTVERRDCGGGAVADQRDEPGDRNPEDEFREMLRELLSGSGGIDPVEPRGRRRPAQRPCQRWPRSSRQLQQAMNSTDDGIDWSVALRQGEERAASAQTPGHRRRAGAASTRPSRSRRCGSTRPSTFSSLPQHPRAAHPARLGRGDDADLVAARRAGRAVSIADALTRRHDASRRPKRCAR